MRYWDLQRQIDTIADAIVQEDIQVERLPQWKVERTNLAKKIEGAQAELAKLIPKGNEERAKALAALEALCAERRRLSKACAAAKSGSRIWQPRSPIWKRPRNPQDLRQ